MCCWQQPSPSPPPSSSPSCRCNFGSGISRSGSVHLLWQELVAAATNSFLLALSGLGLLAAITPTGFFPSAHMSDEGSISLSCCPPWSWTKTNRRRCTLLVLRYYFDRSRAPQWRQWLWHHGRFNFDKNHLLLLPARSAVCPVAAVAHALHLINVSCPNFRAERRRRKRRRLGLLTINLLSDGAAPASTSTTYGLHTAYASAFSAGACSDAIMPS